MPGRRCDVEFTKLGEIYDSTQVNTLLDQCADASRVLVLTHGWNNNMADARQLYDKLLASLQRVAQVGKETLETTTVLQVFWPSKKFTAEHLIPGGGAASGSNTVEIRQSIEALNYDPYRLGDDDPDSTQPVWSTAIAQAVELIDELEGSKQARREFIHCIRTALDPTEAHDDDASMEFFTLDPEDLFGRFGASMDFGPEGWPGGEAGGAASLAGGLSKIKNAAARIANYATYYQMKSRAGTVGRVGLAQTLDRLRERYPALPVHLVGHSFGARAVVSAVAQLPPGGAPVSLALLQAAFSHNGLAAKFDGKRDGAFRTVLHDKRATGPIIVTHTKNDRSVGIAYPLASRIAKDSSASLGDKNDPYGGMGRNGALHTPEVNPTEDFLREWDISKPYDFSPGAVYNLQADQFINDHSAVTGVEVAYATLQAMRNALPR